MPTLVTDPLKRRLFCASFASLKLGHENDEDNLKAYLDPLCINKKAILNLLDSGKEINCANDELKKVWTLRPIADDEEKAMSSSVEYSKKIAIPGECSYIFIWKGRRTMCKRNYHVDPRHENRFFYDDKLKKSVSFITKSSINTLSEDEKMREIDESPPRLLESASRGLTPKEKDAIKDIHFRRWKNYELWNPNYSITRIINSEFLRIWKTLFAIVRLKFEKKLMRRGTQLHAAIELLSLLGLKESSSEVRATEWFENNWVDEAVETEQMSEWITSLRNILQNTVITRQSEHTDFLLLQINNGASCFSIIQQKERLAKSMPLNYCPTSKNAKNKTAGQVEYAYWIIENFSMRDTRIWSKLCDNLFEGNRFCRMPVASFTCFFGNQNCTGKLAAWFNSNAHDSRSACMEFCSPKEVEKGPVV